MELVSVVVPVYKVENYLDRCVISIVEQSYSNLEIILVDDGSPDKCGEMCEEWAKKDSRIKVVHKQNEGLGMTRNAGMAVATGRYVVFIDSDDWVDRDHVKKLYETLKEKNADLCYCGCMRHFSTGEETTHKNVQIPDFYEGEDIINKILLPMIGSDVSEHVDVCVQQSVCMGIYDMEIIRQNNLRFISERQIVSEDLFFNIDYLMHAKRVCSAWMYSYYYFLNVESISQKYDERRYVRTVGFYHYLMNKLDESSLDKATYENRVKRSFFVKVRVLLKQILGSDLSKKEQRRAIEKIVYDKDLVDIIAAFPVEQCVFDVRTVLRQIKKQRISTLIFLLKTKMKIDNVPFFRRSFSKMRGLK